MSNFDQFRRENISNFLPLKIVNSVTKIKINDFFCFLRIFAFWTKRGILTHCVLVCVKVNQKPVFLYSCFLEGRSEISSLSDIDNSTWGWSFWRKIVWLATGLPSMSSKGSMSSSLTKTSTLFLDYQQVQFSNFSILKIYKNFAVELFNFWHFPPIFVLLKMTYLVTLFDPKLKVFKNSSKWTIFGIFD